MGGRVATNENPGKVFLRGSVPSVRGRLDPALQELDSSPFLPATDSRRNADIPGRGNRFANRIRSGLFRDGPRLTRQEVRPLGRRIKPENRFIGFYKNSRERAKNE